MDLFLLFAQELGAHGVQGVRSELVVSLHDREEVELESTVEVDRFGISGAVRFR